MLENRFKWLKTLSEYPLHIETIQPPFYDGASIVWDVLRADQIHTVCSGNKFFKLHYYLQDALQQNHTMIHTWGGPWSNHIVATAYAARQLGLSSLGLIHGKEPKHYSATLQEARSYGMNLQFTGWSSAPEATVIPENSYPVPEGGFGEKGVLGAANLLPGALGSRYTHIICSVGTGTMLAGILRTSAPAQTIGIVISADISLKQRIEALSPDRPFTLNYGFHFGGYARKTPELLAFMNHFYAFNGIPTDFVYTGKLMFGVQSLIQQGFFPEGSRILTIHSGGLQGNRSLQAGQLVY
jgi:1-aminocyclopropane-1-carboxylate deaminase/D-cysteine desulfhydrase-like pyridoxal-dependent ACC family enzyme